MIAKGTLVKITTINGGEIVASLIMNHYLTYDAVIGVGPTDGYAVIPSFRIKAVVVA